MNSPEITSTSFQAYHTPTLTRSVKKEKGLFTLLFRYALPFILLDISVVAVTAFFYFVPMRVLTFLGALLIFYSTIFLFLAVGHRRGKVRDSQLLILLYIAFVAVLGIIYIYAFGYFGALFSIYITNFVVLPVAHIGFVVWKGPRPERFLKTFQVFINTGRMNTREIAVRLGCSLAMLSTFGYGTCIEPNALRVEEVEIVSDKVSEDVTILHLSDMHIRSVGRYERKVFQRIQQLNPDIIVRTGDFIVEYDPEKKDPLLKKLAPLFQQLKPKYGLYAVLGNHDQHLQDYIDEFDERSEGRTLVDEEWVIRSNAGQFRLLGLSYEKSEHGDRALIETWRKMARDEEFTIVLGHVPDYIVDIIDLDIDLCLAGHFHGGGQVRIPFIHSIILDEVLQAKGYRTPGEWGMGYREVRNIRMNVSAGVGTSHLFGLRTMRLNCPPTMTLFTIKKS